MAGGKLCPVHSARATYRTMAGDGEKVPGGISCPLTDGLYTLRTPSDLDFCEGARPGIYVLSVGLAGLHNLGTRIVELRGIEPRVSEPASHPARISGWGGSGFPVSPLVAYAFTRLDRLGCRGCMLCASSVYPCPQRRGVHVAC